MISITTLLCTINTIILVIFGCLYLKKNYVVMTSEEYQTIVQFVEEHSEEAEVTKEKAGGVGFQIYNEEVAEVEEEDD
jgi:predicted membrane protein